MTLTNEQLVMLDAMAYYSRFSDYLSTHSDAIVGKVVEVIKEKGDTTCFNGILGGNADLFLGMREIIEHIDRDEQLKQLQIVYPTSEVDLVVNHAS